MFAAHNGERTSSPYGTEYGNNVGRTTHGLEDHYYRYHTREMLDSLREDYEWGSWYEKEVTEMERTKPTEVKSVDFHVINNAKEHHTERFELVYAKKPVPVLRRGFPFSLTISFQRQYDPKKDEVKLEFYTGSKPSFHKRTLVHLSITDKKEFSQSEKKQWDVRLNYYEGNNLHIEVQIPSIVIVGVWKARVVTKYERKLMRHLCKENIYILFNPWDKDDAVYMDNEIWRQEYVLNDVGKIFVGTYSSPIGRRWLYGQYKPVVLPACMYLLEITRLGYTARANPIKVVRAVVAAINSPDENGVLVGNWSGKYGGGTEPWKWTGSVAILEKYMERVGRSVKYGQCWVFGGITTTVCRALGIPCRTVTNFESHHDTDDTMTMDRFFDENGDKISFKEEDSIWSYHVWNDAWMTRPDLPSGYGGWQAIDATPQETSEGIFRAGPSSLVAIRRGEVGYRYDTSFIYSELNADIVHWQKDKTSDLGWKRISMSKHEVGLFICTKAVDKDDDYGDKDMEIISDEYKHKEGTIEERMSFRNALWIAGLSHIYNIPTDEAEDVALDLLDLDKMMIGKPFYINVDMKNKSDEVRTAFTVLSTHSIYYTGITASKIKRERVKYILQPKQNTVLRVTINPDDYLDKLVDYAIIKIYVIATIQETKQTWSDEKGFQLTKPKLNLEINGSLKVGVEFGLKISFTNPLDRKLTECSLSIESPGITTPYEFDTSDIGPNERFSYEEKLRPQKAEVTKVVVIFNSREIYEIMGSKQLKVEP